MSIRDTGRERESVCVYANNTKTLNPTTPPHSSPPWKRSNQEVASCACAMSPLLARWKNNIQLLGVDYRWIVKKVFLARWNIEPSRDGGWIVSHACTCCSDLLCSAACPRRGGSTNPSPIRSLSVSLLSLSGLHCHSHLRMVYWFYCARHSLFPIWVVASVEHLVVHNLF